MKEPHGTPDPISSLLPHREKLLAYITGKVSSPDHAEDILQDSLLKALRAAPDLREGEKLVPWFYRILNNSIIDFYRRKGTAAKHLEGLGESHEAIADPGPEETANLCSCFRSLIPSLRPEYGALIEELELSGGDPGAMARKLGIEPNNLKVRRHRARHALRKRLEETCRLCARHGCLDCTCQAE